MPTNSNSVLQNVFKVLRPLSKFSLFKYVIFDVHSFFISFYGFVNADEVHSSTEIFLSCRHRRQVISKELRKDQQVL